ncbi:MAG: DUF2089 family protein [Phycisphaerales bacterium]
MPRPWLDSLDEEDLAFIRRFVLSSGSLKAMAEAYGVSYPTVRNRLDRLIAKVRAAEEAGEAGALERLLRMRAAEGRIESKLVAELLRAHQEDVGAAASRDGAVDR